MRKQKAPTSLAIFCSPQFNNLAALSIHRACHRSIVILSPVLVILIKQICINHASPTPPKPILLFVIKFRFGMKANWRTNSAHKSSRTNGDANILKAIKYLRTIKMQKFCKINIQKSNWFLMLFGGWLYEPSLRNCFGWRAYFICLNH